jgi:hypothetical protein
MVPGIRVVDYSYRSNLSAFPEINPAVIHLREVLGDEVYESLARAGENITHAARVVYAFDQIHRAARCAVSDLDIRE